MCIDWEARARIGGVYIGIWTTEGLACVEGYGSWQPKIAVAMQVADVGNHRVYCKECC